MRKELGKKIQTEQEEVLRYKQLYYIYRPYKIQF